MRLILTLIMLISASLNVFADEKKYTLNEILDSEISTDCSKITELESNRNYYSSEEAVDRCKYEISILKAIKKDDVNGFNKAVKKYKFEFDKVYNETFSIMGSDINITPLHTAVTYNAKKIFKMLLDTYTKKRRDINTSITERSHGSFYYNNKKISTECTTPVNLAVIYNNDYMVKEFMTKAYEIINIDRTSQCNSVEFIVKYGNKASFQAYEQGYKLEYNQDIRERKYNEILINAAENDNVELLEYLIKDKKMSVNTADESRYGITPLEAALKKKKPALNAAEKLIELGADLNYPINMTKTVYDLITDLQKNGIWNKPLPKRQEYNLKDTDTANLLNKPQTIDEIRQVKSINVYNDYISKEMLVTKIMKAEKERAAKYNYTSLVKDIDKQYFSNPRTYPDIEFTRKTAIFETQVSYGINNPEFYWSPTGTTIIFRPNNGAYYSIYRLSAKGYKYTHIFGLYSNLIEEHTNKKTVAYEYKDVTFNEAICAEITHIAGNKDLQEQINLLSKNNKLCSNVKSNTYTVQAKNIFDEPDEYKFEIIKNNSKVELKITHKNRLYQYVILEKNNNNVKVIYTGE